MLDPTTQTQVRKVIEDCIASDTNVLDQLREEIRPLRNLTRQIQPRATTSMSIVGTDGGNNQIRFDPYLIQLVRVVDSSNNECCFEAISPTTPIEKLNARHIRDDGSPKTPLGEMMEFLGINTLADLTPFATRTVTRNKPASIYLVKVYRELVEWAILFSIFNKDFATDTLIVFDGLLRSRIFEDNLFRKLLNGIQERIQKQWENSRRRLYLVGVAKSSKLLDRYRLAMALESILHTQYPAYVEIPKEVEKHTFTSRYQRSDDIFGPSGEIDWYVGGKLHLVKFGRNPRDPVWPIDIFGPQAGETPTILGSLLSDAINGFPVPYYPHCLQKAHENAALVEFDFDLLQDYIFKAVRTSLKDEAPALDVFQLQDKNPAFLRYS